jgi:hypothetical protein
MKCRQNTRSQQAGGLLDESSSLHGDIGESLFHSSTVLAAPTYPARE